MERVFTKKKHVFFVLYAILFGGLFKITHFMLCSRFMLFPTFLEKQFFSQGGGGGGKVSKIKKYDFICSSHFMLFLRFVRVGGSRGGGGGGGVVKNFKNMLSCFLHVLCYFQHYYKQVFGGGGGVFLSHFMCSK